jgi:acetylglutamate kinase
MAQDDRDNTKPPGTTSTNDRARTASTLSEALPFMQRYDGATVVIKYGGHAMGDKQLAQDFARDVVQLKQTGVNPVIVHGGGPQIGAMLERLGIKSTFADGLRVTNRETVEIVEMVLAGSINKEIVVAINKAGGKAAGLCGKDGNLVVARKLRRTKKDQGSNIERILELGFVGEPEKINPDILDTFISSDIIPVIAPIGVSKDGETYNINADTVAGALASALNAKRLLLLTDVPGILDSNGELIAELNLEQARKLQSDGTITGGMVPKLETCIRAVEEGVEAVIILDGRVSHAVLLEIYTEHGIGTRIA